MLRVLLLCTIVCGLSTMSAMAQSREEKVRNDRRKIEAEGLWIYNDLAEGFALAKETGKPMLVVLRCIPCVECVKLDDDLVDRDERVRPLLEKFVCVRVVSTNGLDLGLFQFDTDQSFAAFLLHADGTIYGRFGTRSHLTVWADDVSVEGLAQALEGALSLHAGYSQNKAQLASKRGPAPAVAVPELLPRLKGKYTSQLEYGGDVVKSCIHCHQIGDAQRQAYRDQGAEFPESVLFPYPHPKAVGLIFDPKQRATVLRVEPDSPAARAGFQPGDAVLQLAGDPLLSIADVQWVLNRLPAEGAVVQAVVERDGTRQSLELSLEKGWRKRDDISWRVSTWELRRMANGGMRLSAVEGDARISLNLPDNDMALKVVHLGQYAPHDIAKNAGFQKDDILVAFDGRTDLRRETDLIAYALSLPIGTEISATILRDGNRQTLRFATQP